MVIDEGFINVKQVRLKLIKIIVPYFFITLVVVFILTLKYVYTVSDIYSEIESFQSQHSKISVKVLQISKSEKFWHDEFYKPKNYMIEKEYRLSESEIAKLLLTLKPQRDLDNNILPQVACYYPDQLIEFEADGNFLYLSLSRSCGEWAVFIKNKVIFRVFFKQPKVYHYLEELAQKPNWDFTNAKTAIGEAIGN